MKKSVVFLLLIFLFILLALVLSSVYSVVGGQVIEIPTTWQLPELLPDTPEAIQMPGWWEALPTAIPLASPIPGTEQ